MAAIEFNQEAIDQARDDFQKVKYEGSQRELVEETADILEDALDINRLAIKGFILRATKRWQLENNIAISELVEKSPSDRLNAVREIIDYFRADLTKILVNQDKEEELNEAIKNAFTMYLQKYAGR